MTSTYAHSYIVYGCVCVCTQYKSIQETFYANSPQMYKESTHIQKKSHTCIVWKPAKIFHSNYWMGFRKWSDRVGFIQYETFNRSTKLINTKANNFFDRTFQNRRCFTNSLYNFHFDKTIFVRNFHLLYECAKIPQQNQRTNNVANPMECLI